MSAQKRSWFRLGILSELVARSDTKLGRTAIMKLAFLLQTVRGVPLGYNFRLYTYGPYDGDVLDDLGQAEAMRAIESSLVAFPGGYGYEFSTGPESERIRSMAGPEIQGHRDDLSWVLGEFGGRSAADLELLSTIVYADRESFGRHQSVSVEELCRQVREIKPRFSEEYVNDSIRSLRVLGMLQSLGVAA
ncbi:MAG: hypothetical protein ACYC61_30480, partial [Isosphaeraceae bacterium]